MREEDELEVQELAEEEQELYEHFRFVADAGPSYTTGVFHTVPCSTVRLCGINRRFHLLSPSVRQVSHALLTRPPLTFRKSKLSHQSVRLACVKHAASVYPEPGSNSQISF